MARSSQRVVASIGITLALLAASLTASFSVSGSTNRPLNPNTDGQTMVWSQNGEIIADSISGGDRQVLGSGYDPAVSLGQVVWTEGFRLTGVDLATGEPLHLPAATGAEEQDLLPSIAQRHLVWLNRESPDSPIRIMTAYLGSDAPERMELRTLPDDATTVRRPVVSRSTSDVLWGMYTGSDAGGERWELWLSGTMLAAGPADRSSVLGEYDVGGDWVVYDVDRQIHLLIIHDQSFGRLLTTNGATPTTDGRLSSGKTGGRVRRQSGAFSVSIPQPTAISAGHSIWMESI